MLLLLSLPAFAAAPPTFGSAVVITPAVDWGADISVGDVNGDGLNDVALTVGSASSWYDGDRPFGVELSLSDGAGGFTHQSVSASITSGYTATGDLADVDGDGLADLVVGHSGGFAVFLSDGATFATIVDNPGARVGALALGDVDGDGANDLVTLDDTGALSLYRNDGVGGFTLVQSLATASGVVWDHDWDRVRLHDLDGDGDLDLVAAIADSMYSGGDPLAVAINDGSGGFDPTLHTGGMGNVYTLALGDIDGDGLVDIVFAGGHAEVYSIAWNSGFERLQRWPLATYAWQWAVTGDVDGDGDTDVAGTVGFDFGVMLQDGGALTDDGARWDWAKANGFAVANDGYAAADLNGDGCADLVGWAYAQGMTVLPATATGCTGAAPTPWSGDDGGDTGVEDTGSEDTGTDDTGADDTGTDDTGAEDTGTDDTGEDGSGGDDTASMFTDDEEPPPVVRSCATTAGTPASLVGLLVAAAALIRRRR